MPVNIGRGLRLLSASPTATCETKFFSPAECSPWAKWHCRGARRCEGQGGVHVGVVKGVEGASEGESGREARNPIHAKESAKIVFL